MPLFSRTSVYTGFTAAMTVCASLGSWNCASVKKSESSVTDRVQMISGEHPLHVQGVSGRQASLIWKARMPGFISDLSLSDDGKTVLVATIPDLDRDAKQRKNRVSAFSSEGKLRWTSDLSTQVKSQTISKNGNLAVVATHEHEIIAFDGNGKRIWTAEGTCRPIILDWADRVLCYHDDDAEPKVAFDLIDAKSGAKLSSFPIQNDVLSLKISRDQRNVVLGLSDGHVVLVASEFLRDSDQSKVAQPEGKKRHSQVTPVKWHIRVQGEVIDVDVSDGAEPEVAALYRPEAARPGTRGVASQPAPAGVKVSLIGLSGNRVADSILDTSAEQVRLSHDAGSVLIYGNGKAGQHWTWLERKKDLLVARWVRGDTQSAQYSSSVFLTGAAPHSAALLAFEDVKSDNRDSHIVSFDPDGRLSLDLPLGVAEGSYLYLQDYAETSGVLATAHDDGTIGIYRIDVTPDQRGAQARR